MTLRLRPLGNPRFLSVVTVPLLTATDCQRVIDACAPEWEPARVTGYDGDPLKSTRPEVRSVLSQTLPMSGENWPLGELASAVKRVNEETFRFDLDGFALEDRPSVLRYESQVADHFHAHRDVGPESPTRKLSCVVQLSEPSSYRGGSLVFPEEHALAATERGSLTIFPSFLVHQVTPLVSGQRYAIVAWVHGPSFR